MQEGFETLLCAASLEYVAQLGSKQAPSPSSVWQPVQLFCSQTYLPRSTYSVKNASLLRSGKVCSV